MDLLATSISFFGNLIFRLLEKMPGINFCQILHGPDDLQFLLIPKCGTRSLRNAVLKYHDNPVTAKWRAWSYIHYTAKIDEKNPYVVVLRPPLERIHSCWKQKVSSERSGTIFYFWQYYPIIRPDMDFGEFLSAVAKIPAPLREKHFISLKYLINGADINLCQFVPLASLESKLHNWFGVVVASANKTTKTEISDVNARIFEQILGADYALDTQLYQKAVVTSGHTELL